MAETPRGTADSPDTADGESIAPEVVSRTPVGHEGTRVTIEEKPPIWSAGALPAILLIVVSIVIVIIATWAFVAQIVLEESGKGTVSVPIVVSSAVVWSLTIPLVMTMVKIQAPGDSRVLTFFGTYIGTLRRVGISLVPPLTSAKKISVKARNFETNETKVNDYNGNPINIAAIIVWQVADTAKAAFAVEQFQEFIHSQAEAALRHVATQHPYDSPVDGRVSLRGSTDEVSAELADEVAARAAVAGLEIIEARISSLSYAPEIAQAMLQRQQAAAIVDARETIVDGAVSMVESALDSLEEKDIVDLDPERRAAMVSNLLVVLCSDSHTQPVINTGGLYT